MQNPTTTPIPAFPAADTSDTYAVDYGRTLGADWMARSAGWYAPAAEMADDECTCTNPYCQV